jgi:hypothetical protein
MDSLQLPLTPTRLEFWWETYSGTRVSKHSCTFLFQFSSTLGMLYKEFYI